MAQAGVAVPKRARRIDTAPLPRLLEVLADEGAGESAPTRDAVTQRANTRLG